MAADVKIPALGESVNEATIVRWLKEDGAIVRADEAIVEIETEKASMELTADVGGRLSIVKAAGAQVTPGTIVARITEATAAEAAPEAAPPAPSRAAQDRASADHAAPRASAAAAAPPRESPARERAPAPTMAETTAEVGEQSHTSERVSRSHGAVTDGRAAGDGMRQVAEPAEIERVPMTSLRRTIATRLVQAQRDAAILTTFNEVDLSELLAVRRRHRERFKTKHGVDLGLMSLFSRAVVQALADVPVVNAAIDGDDIVYHRHVHLGIAVSTDRGLVVPVVRNADRLSTAEIERAIAALAERARAGRLTPDDLAGGTFTITNGGVFGSLLSTPILNPPQSGILGMHKIQDRPVAVNGQVVIRPMMYVALSYDHRLVDGAQAVTFLVRVKERLEDPARMVLEV